MKTRQELQLLIEYQGKLIETYRDDVSPYVLDNMIDDLNSLRIRLKRVEKAEQRQDHGKPHLKLVS